MKKIIILFIIILIILYWPLKYYLREIPDKTTYDNKLITAEQNSIETITLNKKDVGRTFLLDKYKIYLQDVNINISSEIRNVVVTFRYEGYLITLQFTAPINMYRNIQSFNEELTKGDYLCIKSINVDDRNSDWFDLVIGLNRYNITDNSDNLLYRNKQSKLTNDILTSDYAIKRNNPFEEYPDRKIMVDTYGIVNKNNKDNSARNTEAIRYFFEYQ